MLPFLLMGFQKGVHLGLEQGTGVAEEDVFNASVRKAIEQWAFDKAKLITGTTKEEMKGLLQEAVDKGYGSQKLAGLIRDKFDAMSAPRSLTIARTELTGVINKGTFDTLVAEGHEYKEWSTVLDGRERDSHNEANGQVVAIEEPFKLAGGAGMYPGDPNLPIEEVAQCRCSTIAANQPEDRKRALYDEFLRTHGSLESRFVVALERHFDDQLRRMLLHFPT